MSQLKKNKITEREGLIFIPDISGFTKFVHDMDAKLGKEIVSELLSIILNHNRLNLKVSEIEGDAVLFYRYGTLPSLEELMDQYERMLIAFRKKLTEFMSQRKIDDLNLSLKLIVHAGIISEYKLYGFKKLYGDAVIQAHQLLKNNIPSHNYILITSEFLDKIGRHTSEDLVLPRWISKESSIRDEPNQEQTDFTYFLYDTEILRAEVLKRQQNQSFDPL